MRTLSVVLMLLVLATIVFPHEDALLEAQQLIQSRTDCATLNETQLESIGEYIMEQMHPGASHERMHEIMGFQEGSSQEEEFHINLAKAMYCGTNESNGMMGGGMMGNMMQRILGGNWQNTPSGMMNFYTQPRPGGWTLADILVLILLVGLIVLVYLHTWGKLKKMKTR